MRSRRELAREAISAALRVRCDARVALSDSVCVFDLAEQLGAEVRFVDMPSMEAVYVRASEPLILVSSLRPAGRMAYNCAHELGHHVFGHGAQVDVLSEQERAGSFDPKEFIADCFAGYLLMPKLAVSSAFATREWDPGTCTPVQTFTLAGWLGVSYEAMITHLHRTLRMIGPGHARELLKVKPKELRERIAAPRACSNLLVVDIHWSGRPVDIHVGDMVLAPHGVRLEGACAEVIDDGRDGTLLIGRAPGLGRMVSGVGWAAFLRVSRAGFTGRSRYRHLEEAEDE